MKQKKLIYFNVPVALCQYAIANKLISPFRLYLYFKTNGNKFQINDLSINKACRVLGIISIKTIKSNLKKLTELNWIGFNSRTQTYFVRAFDTLLHSIKSKRFAGVEFHESDLKDFRGFLAGAVWGYLSAKQHWNLRNENKGMVKESNSGGSSQLTTLPYFFPVAISAVSNMLLISLSTAHSYKEQAIRSKYISAKINLIPIDIEPRLITEYLKTFPNLTGKLRIIGNRVFEVGPLLVKSNMRYRRRKKTKHIMGDCKGEMNKEEKLRIQ